MSSRNNRNTPVSTPVVALAIAGGIASGKTSVALALSERLGWPRASFGDGVRAAAAESGLDTSSREMLQAIGESLIAAGWDAFCRRTLAGSDWYPGGPVIIEGVRHVEALEHLRALLHPVPVLLLFMQADHIIRRERFDRRGERAGCGLEQIESHSTEADVLTRLDGMADLSLDGSRPVVKIVDEVVSWLSALPTPLPTSPT